jgi:hypothetical protein
MTDAMECLYEKEYGRYSRYGSELVDATLPSTTHLPIAMPDKFGFLLGSIPAGGHTCPKLPSCISSLSEHLNFLEGV